MTRDEDVRLVNDEIRACMDEAGKLLYRKHGPRAGDFSGVQLPRAHFLMMRAEWLRMQTIPDAAAYLRTEVNQLFADEAAESARREARGMRSAAADAVFTAFTDQFIMGNSWHSTWRSHRQA